VLVVDDDVTEDGAAFLVMELLRGEGLESLWNGHGHRLPVAVVCAIVDQLLDVLAAAHASGVVHRDIKPANLFLTSDGVVKVLDFGIARVRDAMSGGATGTSSGALLGTPAFMAPEQAKGLTHAIDAQTDLWAVGATFFTLVSGQFVHQAENAALLVISTATAPARSLRSVAPDVPVAVAAIVDRALAFEKADRWPSATAMRAALREASLGAFGTLPSRDGLSAFVKEAPTWNDETEAAQTLARAAAARARSDFVGGTTAQPVSSRAAAIPSSPTKRSKRPLWAAAAVVGAGAMGLVAAAKLAKHPQRTVEPASAATVEATEQVSAHATPHPSATTPTATATASERAIQVDDLPVVSARASSSAVHVAVRARPAPSARPSASPRKNCNPPFYFDSRQRKIFKPECL
jgi:serine/threonine protein kinase